MVEQSVDEAGVNQPEIEFRMHPQDYYSQTGPSNQMQVNILDENLGQPGEIETDQNEQSKHSGPIETEHPILEEQPYAAA